jgi:mannosyltransferase
MASEQSPPSEQGLSRPWLWLAGLTALALILRLIRLDQQLWYDEMTTLVQSVRQPFLKILTSYTSKNQHLLYSLLARISILAFGDHIWSLRLPAVLFGTACVPALYALARRMASQGEAMLAAALLTVSYNHVWFSQNARGYTGLAFWTLVATTLFLDVVSRRPSESPNGMKPWLLYGLVVGLGMYTHLTMGLVAAAHGIIFLGLLAGQVRAGQGVSRQQVLHPLAGFALGGAVTLLLYAPILPPLLNRSMGGGVPAMRTEWNNPGWMLLETARGLGAGRLAGVAALAAAALLLLAGLWSVWRENRLAATLLVLPGLLTLISLLVVKQNLWPRFFFFSIGFGFLLLARGALACGALAARLFEKSPEAGTRWGMALGLLMLAASLWPLRAAYIYPKQDFQGAMQFVDAQRQPGEPVMLTGLAIFPYREYYGRDWTAVETRAQLEAARVPGKAAWMIYWSRTYVQARQPEVWNALGTEFSIVRQFRGTLGDGIIFVSRSAETPAAK